MDELATVEYRAKAVMAENVPGIQPSHRSERAHKLAPLLLGANAVMKQLLEEAFQAGRTTGFSEGQSSLRAKLASLLESDRVESASLGHTQPMPVDEQSASGHSIEPLVAQTESVQWRRLLPSQEDYQ